MLWRVQLGDLPVRVEHRDLVPDLDRFLDVVGDQDHGLVQLGLQPDQLVLQGVADDRVDRAERLVHQQHRRVRGQRPGHPDALLLAAGELVRIAAGHVRVQADQVHQLAGPVPGLGLVPAFEQRDGGDVVLDRAVREQAGLLNDVADAPPQPGRLDGGDVGAVQHDPALGRVDQPVDHPQAGGLAATARTDQDHGLAVGDLQVQRVDRYCSARITLCHTLEGDQARASLIVGSGEISWTDHRLLPRAQALTRTYTANQHEYFSSLSWTPEEGVKAAGAGVCEVVTCGEGDHDGRISPSRSIGHAGRNHADL